MAVAGDNSVDLFTNDLGVVPILDGDGRGHEGTDDDGAHDTEERVAHRHDRVRAERSQCALLPRAQANLDAKTTKHLRRVI